MDIIATLTLTSALTGTNVYVCFELDLTVIRSVLLPCLEKVVSISI